MDAMTILEQNPLPFAKLLGIGFVDASPERTMVWQTRVRSEQGRLLGIVTQTQMVLEPRPAPLSAPPCLNHC